MGSWRTHWERSTVINVIHDEKDGYAVFMDCENDPIVNCAVRLAVHKREKTALALARRALVNAIMAVEQKERRIFQRHVEKRRL